MISWYRQQRLRKKLGKYDPYAIVLYTKICRKIENASLVGHLPHGISKFLKFYSEQGGTLTVAVRQGRLVVDLPQRGTYTTFSDNEKVKPK